MSLWEYANPRKFMGLTDRVMMPLFVVTGLLLVVSLGWGFFYTPDDYKQGSTVKIIYLHVPSAMMLLGLITLGAIAVLPFAGAAALRVNLR